MFSKKATNIDEIFTVDLTLCSKVHIFWEGHKIFAKSPPFFWLVLVPVKKGGDFAKFLWPSQNIWTLIIKSTVKILSIFVAFYKNMNFIFQCGIFM